MALRLVFAEDNYLVREGTAALLARSPELAVAALAEDQADLLRAVEQHQPDVVLTDIRMPPTTATEGIAPPPRSGDATPDVGVVVLSQYVGGRPTRRAAERGPGGMGTC